MGLFDKLQGKLDEKKSEGGITPLDLLELPSSLRQIMRLMLRKVTMTYTEVSEAMAAMPESRRLSQEELDNALAELSSQGWLIKYGEGEVITYKVNLRRKHGSKLGQGIWGSLNTRISGLKEDSPAEGSEASAEGSADTES